MPLAQAQFFLRHRLQKLVRVGGNAVGHQLGFLFGKSFELIQQLQFFFFVFR